MELQGDSLVLSLDDHAASLHLESATLNPGTGDRFGMRSRVVPHDDRAAILALRRWLPQLAGDGTPDPQPAARDTLGWPPEGTWQPMESGQSRMMKRAIGAVTLVAVDTRRVSLGMASGYRDPSPMVGAHGSGAVPDGVTPIATFNGASGRGMIEDGLVIVPPEQGVPTVSIDRHGWTRVGAYRGDDAVSLRQGRALGNDVRLMPRSALCRTGDGYLVYASSAAVDEPTLASTLRSSGCADVVALHDGVDEIGFEQTARDRSAEDFFYLVARDDKPTIGDLAWQLDGGAHPAPAWLPAVHSASTQVLGAEVSLMSVAVDRFVWEIRPGGKEKAGRTADRKLSAEQLARTQIAISLGIGFRNTNRRGLVVDGVVALPIRPDLGVVAAEPDGRLSVLRSVELMAPVGDASELRLLAEGGKYRPETKKLGSRRRRSAACLLPDRTMLIALATFDSAEPIASTLLELGCTRIIELNRGKQVRAFVHRAGTDTPPQAEYRDTMLFGMSGQARGRVLTAR